MSQTNKMLAILLVTLLAQRSLAENCLHDAPLSCSAIPDSLHSYDADDWIRVTSQTDAVSLRAELVDYVWSGSRLPTTLPGVTSIWPTTANGLDDSAISFPDLLGAIEPVRVSGIEKLETTVDGLKNTGYLIYSKSDSQRLAVLHQGHADWATGNLDLVANDLLADGWSILALTMPLVGWNEDRTANLPSGDVTWESGTIGHRQMFPLPDPAIDGDNAFRFFLEPTIAGINYTDQSKSIDSIMMVGFSGGGWSTTLAAAVDPRIDTSISVAGSYPLAMQEAQQTGGDDEQTWAGLYDINNGGVASYEELYLLSAVGEGRSAVQINNQFDPCCFYGVLGELYDEKIDQKVAAIGSGEWTYLLDTSHDEHAISSWSQQTILQQTRNVPEPSSTALLFCLLILPSSIRRSRVNA